MLKIAEVKDTPDLAQGQPSNNNTVPDVNNQILDTLLVESGHSWHYYHAHLNSSLVHVILCKAVFSVN